MIVCIEGNDAVGKATQSKILAERLKGTRFAFPNYETPTGKLILSNLKREWAAMSVSAFGVAFPRSDAIRDPWSGQQNVLVFQALQTVNRLELLPEINKALARGPVVFDRYTANGVVYGTLDGLDHEWINLINASLPEPDLWILLDAPVSVGFERRPERRDRYEEDRAFLEKVRVGYLELFKANHHPPCLVCGGEGFANHVCPMCHDRKPWHVVDAVGSVGEVAARIWALVKS